MAMDWSTRRSSAPTRPSGSASSMPTATAPSTPASWTHTTRASSRAWTGNGDGKLTFVEVMSAKMDDFNAADTNGDGRVSYEEVEMFEGKQ
jgi:EF hand